MYAGLATAASHCTVNQTGMLHCTRYIYFWVSSAAIAVKRIASRGGQVTIPWSSIHSHRQCLPKSCSDLGWTCCTVLHTFSGPRCQCESGTAPGPGRQPAPASSSCLNTCTSACKLPQPTSQTAPVELYSTTFNKLSALYGLSL